MNAVGIDVSAAKANVLIIYQTSAKLFLYFYKCLIPQKNYSVKVYFYGIIFWWIVLLL